MTSIADSVNSTVTRTYDGLDRLTQEVTPEGQVSYTYDKAGRRTQMTVDTATPISYTYDNADRLTQITRGSNVVTFTYDAADRRTSTTLPNSTVMSYSYDNADQLTAIDYSRSGTNLGNLTFTYDAVGRRISQGGSYSKLLMPTTVASASYNNANRLTNWGGTALTYDDNGNLTASGSSTYTWNARNELAATSDGSATYRYDGLGRRRGSTISGTSVNYVYDGLNPTKTGATYYMAGLGLDEMYAYINSSNSTFSFVTDALGNTLKLTSSTGVETVDYTYEPYGKSVKTGTAGGVRFQFTGRENDGVTNLYYYRARYYSAQLGRFISEDPIGLAGGMNLYGYVHGDPISNTDPTGEIVPVAVGYARCLASCVAQDAVASQLPGSNCFDLGNSAGNCALGCLSPLNWFGFGNVLNTVRTSKVSKSVACRIRAISKRAWRGY